MGLIKVHIENYKSIRNCTMQVDKINLLLGQNGTGKSNLLSAVQYFFENLISKKESNDIYDNNNTLNNRVKIALTFDLSRIKKICYVNLKSNDSKYKPYYKRIINLIKNSEITIEMIKIKDQHVRWSHDINVRRIIANLFPLYFVDSRNIDLVNWNSLWKDIGDLIKIEDGTGLDVKDRIKKAALSEKMIEKRLESIEEIFDMSNVKISAFTTNDFAATVSQIYFNGTEFEFRDNKLRNFSNGTNSYNYTYLLIYILNMISETKIKDPTIVLDEPEISLHNEMVDRLTNIFCKYSEHMSFIIATHSPRLVKNVLIKDNGFYNIFHISKDGDYSTFSKFNMFRSAQNDLREKYCITDQHASAYFAKSLLLVEGESELELFQNKYLNLLYEKLKYVEVIKGMSNDVIYRIVSPGARNCNIPMVSLIDMDKIYDYKNKIKEKYFMFNNKEKYYFYKKYDNKDNSRANIKNKRKRIYSMAQKCKFNYIPPFFATKDENYIEFVELIKSYFKEYSIFVASTTIEGMLITMKNKDEVLEFLNKYYKENYNKNYDEIINTYNSFKADIDKLNYLRLLFNGKSDLVLTLKQIKEENERNKYSSESYNKILSTISDNKISKTAWITEWLDFYFCNIAGLSYSDNESFYMFEKIVMNDEQKKEILKSFRNDFPELCLLLKMVYNVIK